MATWTDPRTWVSGEIPSAATFNTHVRDNLLAIGQPWLTYAPTLTNWTLGNGTLDGWYIRAGKLVHGKVWLTLGSTSTMSGTLAISLPVSKVVDNAGGTAVTGTAQLFDTSASANRYRFVVQHTATNVRFADQDANAVTGTVPWTWATGDVIFATFSYEAA